MNCRVFCWRLGQICIWLNYWLNHVHFCMITLWRSGCLWTIKSFRILFFCRPEPSPPVYLIELEFKVADNMAWQNPPFCHVFQNQYAIHTNSVINEDFLLKHFFTFLLLNITNTPSFTHMDLETFKILHFYNKWKYTLFNHKHGKSCVSHSHAFTNYSEVTYKVIF